MKKEKLIVGIDVSKLKLDVTILHVNLDLRPVHFVVQNHMKGIGKIFKRLDRLDILYEDVLFCFEDTGVYSMPLCFYLQNKGIEYVMESALAIYRSQGIVRGKNDKLDSNKIALYAQTHLRKLKPSTLPADILIKLKRLVSERDRVVTSIGRF